MLTALPVETIQARPAVRRQQLRELVPLADTTIYEMEQRGEFPKRFNLTPRCPHTRCRATQIPSCRQQ